MLQHVYTHPGEPDFDKIAVNLFNTSSPDNAFLRGVLNIMEEERPASSVETILHGLSIAVGIGVGIVLVIIATTLLVFTCVKWYVSTVYMYVDVHIRIHAYSCTWLYNYVRLLASQTEANVTDLKNTCFTVYVVCTAFSQCHACPCIWYQ